MVDGGADSKIAESDGEAAEELCADKAAPGMIRPAVVWFGEAIQGADMARVEKFMERAPRGRLVFMAAGTSGVVTPASAFVEDAKRLGAETWLVNLELAENAGYFKHVVLGATGAVLPRLFDVEGAAPTLPT